MKLNSLNIDTLRMPKKQQEIHVDAFVEFKTNHYFAGRNHVQWTEINWLNLWHISLTIPTILF